MGLVVIGAIDATRCNDAARRAIDLHITDLHGACMRAQHMGRAVIPFGAVGVECVHLSAGRVMAWNIQRIEIVEIRFNLRAFCHGKAHIRENRGDFFGDLAHGVYAALTAMAGGQGHI